MLLHGDGALQSDRPDVVSNARGRGLMCAVDLPDTETRDRLMDKAYEMGLMILGCGRRSIRFRPVLDITRAEIDEALGLVRKALEKAYQASA